MRNKYAPQERNDKCLSPAQRIGADIRTAKAIYEKMNNVDADTEPVDVNKWLREARKLVKFLRVNTMQQAFEEIVELPYTIEI